MPHPWSWRTAFFVKAQGSALLTMRATDLACAHYVMSECVLHGAAADVEARGVLLVVPVLARLLSFHKASMLRCRVASCFVACVLSDSVFLGLCGLMEPSFPPKVSGVIWAFLARCFQILVGC